VDLDISQMLQKVGTCIIYLSQLNANALYLMHIKKYVPHPHKSLSSNPLSVI